MITDELIKQLLKASQNSDLEELIVLFADAAEVIIEQQLRIEELIHNLEKIRELTNY